MVQIGQCVLDILEIDFITSITFAKLGGLLNEPPGLDLDEDLKHGTDILLQAGDPTLLCYLVDEILVTKKRH